MAAARTSPGGRRVTKTRASELLHYPRLEEPGWRRWVTDLDDSRALNFDSLLYVALTRATDRLTTLVEQNTLRRLLGG